MYHFILFQTYSLKSPYVHSFLYYTALSVCHKIIDLQFIYLPISLLIYVNSILNFVTNKLSL
jgi:hypothetical protein